MKDKALIFSGSGNPVFARKLSEMLKAPMGKQEVGKYPNDEIRVRILEEINNKTVIVVQTLASPIESNFFEFALLVDALRRSNPKTIIGVIPWLAYSLQDEQFLPGEAISAKLISQWLDCLRLNVIIIVDVHSNKVVSNFKTKTIIVPQIEIIKDIIQQRISMNTIFVAPDSGSDERTKTIANRFKIKMLTLNKIRDRYTGKIHYTEFHENVSGKDCFIFDDVIITGNTVIDSALLLKEHGAKSIVVYCTHALFAKDSIPRIKQSPIDELVVTDTLLISKNQQFNKLKIISAVPAVANSINYLLNK